MSLLISAPTLLPCPQPTILPGCGGSALERVRAEATLRNRSAPSTESVRLLRLFILHVLKRPGDITLSLLSRNAIIRRAKRHFLLSRAGH
jgi:hypothetical protein